MPFVVKLEGATVMHGGPFEPLPDTTNGNVFRPTFASPDEAVQ